MGDGQAGGVVPTSDRAEPTNPGKRNRSVVSRIPGASWSIDARNRDHRRNDRPGARRTLRAACPGSATPRVLLAGDPEEARDLAQDAFVKMAGRFRHLRQPDAFDAYMRRTIVNLHTSGLRRLRVERSSLAREAALSVPAAVADDFEVRDEMWHAILCLPARQRAAIVLRYYEDLSESQAADILSCSVEALNQLVVRATKNLRARSRGAIMNDLEHGSAMRSSATKPTRHHSAPPRHVVRLAGRIGGRSGTWSSGASAPPSLSLRSRASANSCERINPRPSSIIPPRRRRVSRRDRTRPRCTPGRTTTRTWLAFTPWTD